MNFSANPALLLASPPSPSDEAQEKLLSHAHSKPDVIPRLEVGIRPTGPQPMDKRRPHMFYSRFAAFVVLEISFIALAVAALNKPIPLYIPLQLDDADVKGGFTVIFILWHTLALLAASYLLDDAFSREWSVQLDKLEPGTTDKVSTITSGILDRIVYFSDERSSGTFKLAFLASLTLTALVKLAPGTISIATTLIDIPLPIQIANLSSQFDPLGVDPSFLAITSRADLIARLEQVEHSSFGFRVQPNWMVAWPSLNLTQLTGIVDYSTDVVEFHHNCHWEAPGIQNYTAGLNIEEMIVEAAGKLWSSDLASTTHPELRIEGSAIHILTPVLRNTSTSAFLFLGGNNTYRRTEHPNTSFALDLGTLPSLLMPTGVGLEAWNYVVVASLASVVVCDPQIRLSGGRVRLSMNGTLQVLSSGHPLIGNIPLDTANAIFSRALFIGVEEYGPMKFSNNINTLSGALFMSDTSVDWQNEQAAQNISPLDLDSINRNMDRFVLSAVKAFSDGYHTAGSSLNESFSLTPTTAVGREERLVLTSTRRLLIPVAILVAISLVLLSILCQLAIAQNRLTFDLQNVLRVLQDRVKPEQNTH